MTGHAPSSGRSRRNWPWPGTAACARSRSPRSRATAAPSRPDAPAITTTRRASPRPWRTSRATSPAPDGAPASGRLRARRQQARAAAVALARPLLEQVRPELLDDDVVDAVEPLLDFGDTGPGIRGPDLGRVGARFRRSDAGGRELELLGDAAGKLLPARLHFLVLLLGQPRDLGGAAQLLEGRARVVLRPAGLVRPLRRKGGSPAESLELLQRFRIPRSCHTAPDASQTA